MNVPDYHIISYDPKYEDELTNLERDSSQGKWIKLELLKDQFLSRAIVFDDYAAYLAITKAGKVIGVNVVAMVDIKVNDISIRSGILFDAKVLSVFRNSGVSKKILLHIWKNYFLPKGIKYVISTMKSSNKAILKLGRVLGLPIYTHRFYYLTIPLHKRLKTNNHAKGQVKFSPKYFGSIQDRSKYIIKMNNGINIWRTHLMYQLKIKKLNHFLKGVVRIINIFQSRQNKLPNEGKVIRLAFLYGLNAENLVDYNQVCENLDRDGIDFITICCNKKDVIFNYLKPLSINAYPYLLLSTFPISKTDKIELDVRCF